MKMKNAMSAMLAFMCAVSLTACGAEPDPYEGVEPDFRNVNWGMTTEEVKAREGDNVPIENDSENAVYGLLYENIEVLDHPASLGYSFKNDKLHSATYNIKVTEKIDYMINNEFFNIADDISTKYGTPDDDTILIYYKDKLYTDPMTFYDIDGFTYDTSDIGDYAMSIYSMTDRKSVV